jgi:hypothetical protein
MEDGIGEAVGQKPDFNCDGAKAQADRREAELV